LLGEFYEKSSQEELDELSSALASLAEEKRKYDQSSDRLHLLLYTGRRMEIYIRCIEKLHEMSSRGFESGRMKALFHKVEGIRSSEGYQSCVKALEEYHSRITFPKVMMVALNTQEDAHPTEMGVLWESTEVQELNPLLEMQEAAQPAKSLFPEMPYTRERYGTHFEEFLSKSLEKEWKNKVNKGMDLWKKITAPEEESIGALWEEFAFYAVGLRVMNTFTQRGYQVCRGEVTQEVLLKAEGMVYPELVLNADNIEGNPVILINGGGVIVTGANHSGKTSYLKTIGQTILLAQLGFYVPAVKVAFRPVKHIYTLFSAGEDREMTASRMGVEIKILAEMLEKVEPDDLVLINEPLTSTNPVEAISICAELVQKFLEKKVSNLMVTHLYDVYFLLKTTLPEALQPQLKSLVTQAYYDENEGMVYSYKLVESEPLGNSYAKQTAESFGITLQDLVKNPEELSVTNAFCEKEGEQAMYTREEANHGISD
ncbi:MAG: hypothetical protein IJ315_05390, partial [Firmicutes bacterium]|nr:hypothetical protein [Bacillota bacterium]